MQKSNTYLEDIQINNILVMYTLAGTHFKHKPADNLEHGDERTRLIRSCQTGLRVLQQSIHCNFAIK